MIRRFPFVILLAALCCLIPFGAMAQTPTLHLVGDAAYAPYSFNYGGVFKGIDVEVVQELGIRLGIPVRVELLSRTDMLRKLNEGSCDGLLALRPTDENKAKAFFLRTHPLHVSTYSAFIRRAAQFEVTGLEDLSGKTVGLLEAVDLGRKFKQAVKDGQVTVKTYANKSRAIGALLKGEVDAFIGQTKATHHLLGKMGMTNTVQAEGKPLFKRGGEYLALLKASAYPEKESLLKLMELALADIFADGTYRRIVHRYVL